MAIVTEVVQGLYGGEAQVATAMGTDNQSAITFALLPHAPNALVIGASMSMTTDGWASIILDEADTRALIDWCLAHINQSTGTLQ